MTRCKTIAALLLVAASSHAAIEDATEDAYATEFVAGNLVFIVFHELAHLVIDDFEVPVLGNNEDAADTLAAVFLIRLDHSRPEGDFQLIRMLLAATDGQRILWQRGLEKDNPIIYLANHPLSVQRAARIACLAYGSDPELLEPVPEIVGLPEFRAFWCEEEYDAAERAWFWVRDSYVRKNPGSTIGHQVKYGPTSDPDRQAIRDRLMQSRVLEKVMEIAEDNMMLRDDITFITKSCGEPNAYWDGNERELVVCYQLVEALYKLAEDEHLREMVDQIREFHRNDRAGT